jgi:L-fuculose-phosphate aldolase
MRFDLLHPRQQLVQIMDRIYRYGLTTTSGGNRSVLDEGGDLWIAPSAVDKGNLQPGDIMCLKAAGQVLGPHKPSGEYAFHQAIYEKRRDVRAIVHAHSPALVSFSIARQLPDTRNIPLVPHGQQYTAPEKISAAISPRSPAILIRNDTVLTTGASVHQAFDRLEVADFTAFSLLNALPIGPLVPIGEAEVEALEAKFG